MKVNMKFGTKCKTEDWEKKTDLWDNTYFSTTSKLMYIDQVEWEFPFPRPVLNKLSQEVKVIDLQ